MTTSHWKIVCALACTLLAGIVNAELIVIYDSGRSWPIDEFLGPPKNNRPSGDQQLSSTAMLGVAEPRNLLPIRSPGLSPGDVKGREHDFRFAQAFFLVGSDARSQRWLEEHRDQLLQFGAVGLLVQAESLQDLEVMAEIANGLPITPASGSDIAKALGVAHYPVAISDGRIWQ